MFRLAVRPTPRHETDGLVYLSAKYLDWLFIQNEGGVPMRSLGKTVPNMVPEIIRDSPFVFRRSRPALHLAAEIFERGKMAALHVYFVESEDLGVAAYVSTVYLLCLILTPRQKQHQQKQQLQPLCFRNQPCMFPNRPCSTHV